MKPSDVLMPKKPAQSGDFDWIDTPQFHWIQIFFAFAIPSAIAYVGFHFILPIVYNSGVAAVVAWPAIASLLLAAFTIVPLLLMRREARQLNISLRSRMCLKPISRKQWLFAILVLVIGLVAAIGFGRLIPLWSELIGLQAPEYFPFFLDPTIDPMSLDPKILTPGFELKGAYWLIGLITLTLLLNILVEEFYFRAWLLPKMQSLGKLSWVVNGIAFALYHSFQLWLIPQILPLSLFMAFVIFKTKSIWPVLCIHMAVNSLSVAALIFLIIA